MGKGITQGDPASPMIFNTMLDAVLLVVLAEVCRPQEAHHGLVGAVGGRNLILYVDDIRISVRDPDWVQDALSVMVDMFLRISLEMNLEKTKAMV